MGYYPHLEGAYTGQMCTQSTLHYHCLVLPGDKYPTVPFKSKLTVHCESRFSTRFAIPGRIENQESRASYRESSRGSSLTGQKTKDSPITDFSIILQRPAGVTQHGMVIFGIRESDSMLERRPIFYLSYKAKCFFKDICIKLHFLK